VTTLIVAHDAPKQQLDAPLKTEAELPRPPASGGSTQKAEQIANWIVLTVLFASSALMCIHMAGTSDPDIWWHLRVGEWILQHHAIPHVDSFSGPLRGTPWLAYSWLFELIVVKLFYWLGQVGIVAYTSGMIVAITVALYHLIRRLQADFSLSVLLTFASLYCMGHMYTPRPWMFTILLFILELDILMHVRKTGQTRELAWLPLIFAVWANVHVEYIYGLFVLGLAFVESVVTWRKPDAFPRVQPLWMGGALLASILATLANPYGWRIYAVVYDLAVHGGGLSRISEMQANPFRDLANYGVLFFALASVGALAWTRRFRLFEVGLFLFATVLSFRSQRDVWIMATAGAAILASAITGKHKSTIRLPWFAPALAVCAAALLVWAGFRVMHVTNNVLETKAAKTMPMRAVEAIRANGYTGPLYNDFNWGGYLIWTLRMPVSMDGRSNIYGNERIERSIATWNAEPDWNTDPQLTSAGIVIGPVKSALVQVLRMDPRFRLVYEDSLAAVFVARKAPPQ
jgi:hypothetical protein